MGVMWNPANSCYYRSLETAARNQYLATQGTSGTPTVKTATGINYVVDVPHAGPSAACPTPATTSAAPGSEARTKPERGATRKAAAKQALSKAMRERTKQAAEHQPLPAGIRKG